MKPAVLSRAAVFLAAFGSAAWAAVAADLSASDVTKSLETIRQTADAVASGRDKTPTQLRDAARTIGVEWEKVEPAVAKDFLVETRFANQSIATFERDWHDARKARTEAKDVSAKVAQLLSAQRQNATPAPSPETSAGPSPKPSEEASPSHAATSAPATPAPTKSA